jgi:hypothetical protein
MLPRVVVASAGAAGPTWSQAALRRTGLPCYTRLKFGRRELQLDMLEVGGSKPSPPTNPHLQLGNSACLRRLRALVLAAPEHPLRRTGGLPDVILALVVPALVRLRVRVVLEEVAVVGGAPERITEDLVGGVDLRHSPLCPGGVRDVGVVLPRQPAVGPLYDLHLCPGVDLEDLVQGSLHRHMGSVRRKVRLQALEHLVEDGGVDGVEAAEKGGSGHGRCRGGTVRITAKRTGRFGSNGPPRSAETDRAGA